MSVDIIFGHNRFKNLAKIKISFKNWPKALNILFNWQNFAKSFWSHCFCLSLSMRHYNTHTLFLSHIGITSSHLHKHSISNFFSNKSHFESLSKFILIKKKFPGRERKINFFKRTALRVKFDSEQCDHIAIWVTFKASSNNFWPKSLIFWHVFGQFLEEVK